MPAETGFSIGDESAQLRILWLHGYTGAPGAFRETAERIAAELGAFVHVPLLPGHGTHEEDLISFEFEDFFEAARRGARGTCRDGSTFVVIGYSFGGYLAAKIAHEFGADALALALTPFLPRWPGSLPGAEQVMGLRQFWNKYLTAEDVREREGTFYYPDVPGRSLGFVKRGNRLMREVLPALSCPMLTIHNVGDPVAHQSSGQALLRLRAPIVGDCACVLDGGRHTLFFRPDHTREQELLLEFLRKARERSPGSEILATESFSAVESDYGSQRPKNSVPSAAVSTGSPC